MTRTNGKSLGLVLLTAWFGTGLGAQQREHTDHNRPDSGRRPAIERFLKKHPGVRKERKRAADTDGDGKLSPAERQHLKGLIQERLRAHQQGNQDEGHRGGGRRDIARKRVREKVRDKVRDEVRERRRNHREDVHDRRAKVRDKARAHHHNVKQRIHKRRQEHREHARDHRAKVRDKARKHTAKKVRRVAAKKKR
ncbi:MAG TPA: hypothetical protein ENI87_14530 [bacterium]|nr:hypothetical protein [bacterium]